MGEDRHARCDEDCDRFRPIHVSFKRRHIHLRLDLIAVAAVLSWLIFNALR